ncbi:hypothetical protein BH11ACT3_BH11ACT3_02640 [soil metagenome]
MQQASQDRPVVLRAPSSAVVFGLVAAVAVVFVGDAVVRGAWSLAAQAAGPAALAVWAAWLLLVRPSIRLESDRAVVVNVGRVTEVPWSRVADIRRRLQLVLDLEDGSRVECWGSPFPTRAGVNRNATSADVAAPDTALTVLRSAWLSGSHDTTLPVVRRADALALGIGAAALAATIFSITAGSIP